MVYLVAPKTFTEAAPFRPVPWVLAAYLAFTLLRLTLAHRHRLPEWLRYLSIGIDMTLLVGLIWSFHLQYQQPPSFYLKAPTLLYVFIFIALRTLNFDARKVVTAGLIAAAGWMVLVVYVITIDPRDSMITRDYVHYMTSNSVLIGAEVDKVISILVVTAILGFAIMRNRRLLTYAVTESASNQDLARFVPAEVANLIKTSADGVQVGSGEPREATVLFLDLEGFTTLSERLAPQDLVRTLNAFYAAVAEPIVRHDGVITQFQGDAILATFNAPRLNADHAANAIQAALDIQALLQERTFGEGLALRARIGINTGVVIHGLIGTPGPARLHGDRRRGQHRRPAGGPEQDLRHLDHRLRVDPGPCRAAAIRVRFAGRSARPRADDTDAHLQGRAGSGSVTHRAQLLEQTGQVRARDRLVPVAEILGLEEMGPLLQGAQEDDLARVVLGIGLAGRFLAQQCAVAHELLPWRAEAGKVDVDEETPVVAARRPRVAGRQDVTAHAMPKHERRPGGHARETARRCATRCS